MISKMRIIALIVLVYVHILYELCRKISNLSSSTYMFLLFLYIPIYNDAPVVAVKRKPHETFCKEAEHCLWFCSNQIKRQTNLEKIILRTEILKAVMVVFLMIRGLGSTV
jgi:hypothetical protein